MAGGDASKRVSKWYFGGLASAGAACCTHPLDLLKVHLQTAGSEKTSLFRSTANIVKNQGILALYNGLSASLLRQLTYSTTRFAIYDVSYHTLCRNLTKKYLLVNLEKWRLFSLTINQYDGESC